jgi:hypothetical protein
MVAQSPLKLGRRDSLWGLARTEELSAVLRDEFDDQFDFQGGMTWQLGGTDGHTGMSAGVTKNGHE